MAKIEYPLERVIEVKIKRVEAQEKVVQMREQELKLEEKALKDREAERDKVIQHRLDKLNQMRDEMDKGTTTDKIIQMKVYIKEVDERVKIEKKKVEDQKEKVKVAEKNLMIAKEELRIKRQEVDKLKTHREDWMKEKIKEVEIGEEKEMDEIGQVLYTLHQRRGY